MKNIIAFSLLMFATFTATQLHAAAIRMILDDASNCDMCTEVRFWDPSIKPAKVQREGNTRFVILPENVTEGTSVFAFGEKCPSLSSCLIVCISDILPAKDGGTIKCTKAQR